jgi:hypothetical protein
MSNLLDNDSLQSPTSKSTSPSMKALELALSLFDFCSTSTGEPVAVRKSAPNVALEFNGRGLTLRNVLAEEVLKRLGWMLTDKAFKEASHLLSAEAARNPREVALRVGAVAESIYIDLGDSSEEVIEVSANGWAIVKDSPIPFLRTPLTRSMNRPTRGGNVQDLYRFFNVPVHMRDVFLGVLVASFFENIPHPVIQFEGEQGSGKSFAGQLFTDLLDPSSIPRRKPPKDIETWTTTAKGSYVIGIDNVASISTFFSDALCRAVTGEGNVERELFTNGGLYIVKFRRIVLINGIRITGIQDDLADRLIKFKLPVIPDSERETEASILDDWSKLCPGIYGAILDVVSQVQAILPDLRMAEMPRMADFSRILAAMDQAVGTDSLTQYLDEVKFSAVSSVSEDPIILTIKEALRSHPFAGSAKVLLDRIVANVGVNPLPPGFPTNPRALSNYLGKVCPTLRKAGWKAEDGGNSNHGNVVIWLLEAPTK